MSVVNERRKGKRPMGRKAKTVGERMMQGKGTDYDALQKRDLGTAMGQTAIGTPYSGPKSLAQRMRQG